jgi:excisionase family DNA binding protein
VQSVESVLSDEIAAGPESDESATCVEPLAPAEDEPDFLDVEEAAKALGVSPMTVRRLYDSRTLPGYRQGRTRKILRTFVEGFRVEVNAGRQPVLQDYAAAWFEQAQAVAS